MYTWTDSPHLVPFEDTPHPAALPTKPAPGTPGKKRLKGQLADHIATIADLQRVLYAHDTHALLLVFQGMDASGKDSTIRHVLSGVNPAGVNVVSFKRPSSTELDHDFLWRVSRTLPRRGHIGVFNRSHYEEVLAVRVHPEYLHRARLRSRRMLEDIWARRYRSIRTFEQHLADNGTIVLKFFLHLSKEEQRQRLLRRLERPDKNWKFELGDLREREFWDDYQQAFGRVLEETSRPWAPWYAIPADDKPYMRTAVAKIVAETLQRLDIAWPEPAPELMVRLGEIRRKLEDEAP